MEETKVSYDDMEPELLIIQSLNQSLGNLRMISSTGEENSLHDLLTIPELNEIEDLDDTTIEFVEELVKNTDEQAIINENNEDISQKLEIIEENNLLNDLMNDESPSDLKTTENSESSDNEREKLNSSASSLSSKFSFLSNFFGSTKKETSSSSSSTSRSSYFSRLFNRRKEETISPGSDFSIPSCNSQNDTPEVDSEDMEIAERIIEDTEAQGPTGTLHLSSIARTVNRPILAFSSSMSLRHHAGRNIDGDPILLQFHSARPGMVTGHWTLLGNRDPDGVPMDLNNCLFNVVFAQTGRKPSMLRQETIIEMRKNIRSLARRIRVMLKKHECEGLVILIGGARYDGSSPNDAKRVIDASQGGRCHPGHQQGHPRGHASYPRASGTTESAENYSSGGGWKTGFLSRKDQDAVGHMSLRTPEAQRAMQALNNGSQSQSVHLIPSAVGGSLPECAEFTNGKMGPPVPIKSLVLVLRHHAGHADDPDYPVFVHTFYPKVR